MRDSREKGAGMRDQDTPFQTLIDSFVYIISSNVIGPDKTKTNLFGREGLGLFLFFLLPHAWRPYSNIILAKGNSVKLAINYTKHIIYLFSHHK